MEDSNSHTYGHSGVVRAIHPFIQHYLDTPFLPGIFQCTKDTTVGKRQHSNSMPSSSLKSIEIGRADQIMQMADGIMLHMAWSKKKKMNWSNRVE